jgi:hypothetical protein
MVIGLGHVTVTEMPWAAALVIAGVLLGVILAVASFARH